MIVNYTTLGNIPFDLSRGKIYDFDVFFAQCRDSITRTLVARAHVHCTPYNIMTYTSRKRSIAENLETSRFNIASFGRHGSYAYVYGEILARIAGRVEERLLKADIISRRTSGKNGF